MLCLQNNYTKRYRLIKLNNIIYEKNIVLQACYLPCSLLDLFEHNSQWVPSSLERNNISFFFSFTSFRYKSYLSIIVQTTVPFLPFLFLRNILLIQWIMKELIKIKFEKQTNLPFPHDNIDSLRNLLTATILINSYLKKIVRNFHR